VPQVVVVSYVVAFFAGAVGVLSIFVSLSTAAGLIGTVLALGIVVALWLKRIDISKNAKRALLRDPASEKTP
jgi:hypothetical protein